MKVQRCMLFYEVVVAAAAERYQDLLLVQGQVRVPLRCIGVVEELEKVLFESAAASPVMVLLSSVLEVQVGHCTQDHRTPYNWLFGWVNSLC